MRHPSSSQRIEFAVAVLVLSVCGVVSAQTTSAPGIDVEVYNPVDGSNSFCVVPYEIFWAHVFIRPGDVNLTCDLTCGNDVPGGSASLAAGVIDVGFDPALLSIANAESNPDPGYAAVDGLVQLQFVGEGRAGWALAGDWINDGDPDRGLNDPCVMQKLETAGWVFRLLFEAGTEGSTTLHLRRQTDPSPFPLSFADICGSEAYTIANGGVNEVVDATVTIDSACSSLIFEDGFEFGDTSRWSATVPPIGIKAVESERIGSPAPGAVRRPTLTEGGAF